MKKYLGEICVLLAGILWGCISLTVRPLQSFGFSSIQITVVRSIFTVLMLAIYIAIKDVKLFKIKLKDFPIFIGSGLLSFLFFNFCYMSSMRENSVSVACMLMYTSPIWVTIFSRIFFKEKVNPIKIITLFGALGGCVLVAFSSSIKITLIGLLFGLGSGLGYGLYSIFGKVASRKYKPETTTFYTFVVASVCGIPLCNVWELPTLISQNYLSIAYFCAIALFCTVLTYVFYNIGLTKIEAGIASIIAIIEPVVASIVGFIVYKETLTVWGIFGIVLVVVSLVLLELIGNKTIKVNKVTAN